MQKKAYRKQCWLLSSSFAHCQLGSLPGIQLAAIIGLLLSYATFKWASVEACPASHCTEATFVILSSESFSKWLCKDHFQTFSLPYILEGMHILYLWLCGPIKVLTWTEPPLIAPSGLSQQWKSGGRFLLTMRPHTKLCTNSTWLLSQTLLDVVMTPCVSRKRKGVDGQGDNKSSRRKHFKSRTILRDTSLCLILVFGLLQYKDRSRLQNPKHGLLFSTAVWAFHKRKKLVVFV